MGIERVLLAVADAAEGYEPTLALFVAALGAEARLFALPLAHRLRLAGIRTEIEHRDAGLKAQLKRADKLKSRLALLIGEDELRTGKLTLKDLATGQQHQVSVEDIESRVHQLLD